MVTGNYIKEKILWLLPFYMVMATYFYYEIVPRTMRTGIVSNLLNRGLNLLATGYTLQYRFFEK